MGKNGITALQKTVLTHASALRFAVVFQMLSLDEYGGGAEAKYNSWVILEKAAAVREEAGGS